MSKKLFSYLKTKKNKECPLPVLFQKRPQHASGNAHSWPNTLLYALTQCLRLFVVLPLSPLSVDMKFLSYKTALLCALASAKQVASLHAVSVHPSCTQFTSDSFKFALCMNAVPKFISDTYSSMAFELLSFCIQGAEEVAFCPVSVLCT